MPTGVGTALLISAITGAGAQVAGAAINSKAQGNAADKQAEAIEKGIALQKQMYEQDRADLGGYRALGNGAVGNLAYLAGINLPAEAPAAPAMPTAPTGQNTLASLGKPPGSFGSTALQGTLDKVNSVMDRMNKGEFGPTITVSKGSVRRVIPQSLLAKAQQEGYQQVPT